MSNYEDIATNVVIHGSPKLDSIIPTSGPNKGKETAVLNLRAFHPNFRKNQETGEFERQDSDWYNVRYYGAAAKKMAGLIHNGMILEVRGSVTDSTYTGKDGKVYESKDITAKTLAVTLNQPGLRSIDFQKPEKKHEHAKGEPSVER